MIRIEQLYSIFRKHPNVSTDSRTCLPGALFFALKGDTFDGNDYIEQALETGAAYAVGDRADLPNDRKVIRVNDALQTLQDLANYHRKQMTATVIAITGTNGKTTSKELIAAALSAKYPTLYTQGNLNNLIGVPLTLLQLDPKHRFAVVEMGANHPGEIRALCRIAEPAYGLITNVGKAHLEGFGSFEGVVRAKAELYDFLRNTGGTAFVHTDNSVLSGLCTSLPTVVCYGTASEAFVSGKITAAAPVLALEWKGGSITTRLVGTYNFENVLAAICVASYFGVEEDRINAAVEGYVPTNNRSQSVDTGRNRLIMDAYNANPSSMQAALESFSALRVCPKMLILGEMKELGDYSREEHQKLMDRIPADVDKVFLTGENYAGCKSVSPNWKLFPTTDALGKYLQTHPIEGYHILIKGSRSNRLEKIVSSL
jgi:UDP-N-acetylmuramoyl-tripeptide--D-alanyl-D-alanine ligase